MTILRVILEPMLSTSLNGLSRYTEELTRGLIAMAPPSCSVQGVVPASTESQYKLIESRLPGLDGLYKSSLARREILAAWQHGFTRLPGRGMLHSPSLLAPLRKHDRVNESGEQVVVTIHDALPWTHPEAYSPSVLSWYRAMAGRAQRYADAIVVPTHSVANELADVLDLGDRIRVIGGAPSASLTPPLDTDERALALDLPERYVLASGSLEPRKGIQALIKAFALPELAGVPLLIVGAPDWRGVKLEDVVEASGLPDGSVRALGPLSDEDLAVAIERAAVFVFPSTADGFGMPVIEAMSIGTPVVHADAPAVAEVAADAGVLVEAGGDGYAERLAAAVDSVLSDSELAERLRHSGRDRARAFSWITSAEKVWQLHADL